MRSVIMLMIFLCTTIDARHGCDTLSDTKLIWSQFNNCSEIILKNKSISVIEINEESHYGILTKLDISENMLTFLPEGFLSNAIALKEVHLQGNILESLPKTFLINSSSLKILRLERNRLSVIPASVFHGSLLNLTVDCRCDLISNILMHLNTNATKYSFTAMCQMSTKLTHIKDFYETNCSKQYLVLYIVSPIIAIGIIAGGTALYMWKRKRSSTDLENKGASNMSPAHGQPRYMSRNLEDTPATSSPGQRQDYENVFIGHFQTTETKPYRSLESRNQPGNYSSKCAAEEDIYLESDINEGDQPIYTNTQGIYYNYSEPTSVKNQHKEEDDVYILPDH